MSEENNSYEPVVEAVDELQDAVNKNTAILRILLGLLVKPPVVTRRAGQAIHAVATWRLHDITGLPICWLFGEYDREGERIAFAYDGTVYRVYEGNIHDGLLKVVKGVEVYGRRRESTFDDPVPFDDESGVDIVVMRDGLPIREMQIDSGDAGIASYGWRRLNSDSVESVLHMDIKDYYIAVTPEELKISEKE